MPVKEFCCRKHVFWGLYLIPIFFGGIAVCGFVTGFYLHTKYDWLPREDIMYIALYLPLFSIFSGAFCWYIYFCNTKIRISLTDNELIYTNRKGTFMIPYSSINKLKLPSGRLWGGWVLVKSEIKSICITYSIEGIDEFLISFKKALDVNGFSRCYDRNLFFQFYRTSVNVNNLWERVYSLIWKYIFSVLITVLFSACFTYHINLKSLEAGFYSVMSGYYAILIYLISEIIIYRNLLKNSNEEEFTCPPRDLDYEKSVYKRSVLYGAMGYFIVLVVVLHFV
ncbi:MAG: hypothetical protein ACYTFY_09910 [Planctomycetota bacterium]|jgi:hypothetical protein